MAGLLSLFFCLVVVVTCFWVHNTFEGFAGLVVFLVLVAFGFGGWLCMLSQVAVVVLLIRVTC